MLFGHDLKDRMYKGEEIFFFCFFFLKHIIDDEFSVRPEEYKERNSVVSQDGESHLRDEDCSIHTPTNKSRHPVLRNDSDLQLDNLMCDGDATTHAIDALSSVSSNLSLNSWCSSVSQHSRDSQDNNPPAIFHCSSQDSQEESYGNL